MTATTDCGQADTSEPTDAELVAHPLMQIFEWLGLPGIAARVRGATLPATRSRQGAEWREE